MPGPNMNQGLQQRSEQAFGEHLTWDALSTPFLNSAQQVWKHTLEVPPRAFIYACRQHSHLGEPRAGGLRGMTPAAHDLSGCMTHHASMAMPSGQSGSMLCMIGSMLWMRKCMAQLKIYCHQDLRCPEECSRLILSQQHGPAIQA